ncbi:SDR family NAD(P)-dependent oxidoreductase [Paenibacillus rigui]|uniref:3-ketoacyl-ACP reductase n=1 Tax=Paenibacillus rigui TaxID=554312 RepID=A0A229UW78_9BACL|nr:SDR family oxidoreductase [Paenibacillus rigui]OXM87692.1 3-ketoacyl-ACP reductase [Paenibacillus rigui]
MSFQGKVIMVTGAGQGIGQAIAIAYAQQGGCLIVVDREEDRLRHTVQRIREAGAEAFEYIVDVSKPEQLEACFQQITDHHGRLDILINNAGLGRWVSPYELSLKDWDYVINTNLRGTFVCSREAAKLMKKQETGGSIVNIASTRAFMSEPSSEAYAASKGGIVALTHALAVSLGPDKIQVNAISPGWIETGDYNALKPSDHAQHPAGRVGRPDDIARACLYLTHPDNRFVTGTNVMIDGGMTRKMIYEE